MVIPVTFSPSGTTHLPSIEDALRDGIALMYRADDLTRKDYSYDVTDASKGVRIFVGPFAATEGPPKQRKLVLPQLLITVAVNTRWTYAMNQGGERRVVVVITHLEAQDSEYLSTNVTDFEVTPEARLARLERVLMCGTLFKEGQTSNSAKVVDPYRTPILESGLYDPAAIRYLNGLAPELSRQLSVVGEVAVGYSLSAAYTVDVSNREDMTEGGFE